MSLLKRIIVSCIAGGVVLGAVSCAAESEPTAQPESATASAPEPAVETEPEAEPEPQPGNGPECPTGHCVSVAVAGDLLFHESLWLPFAIEPNEQGHNFDFVPLLEGQREYLAHSDLNICQMETPLAPSGGPYQAYPQFSTPPEVAVAAKDVGFDVCTTASNHTVDMGTEGLDRTLDVLDEVGIAHTGSYRTPEEHDEVLIVEANGAKVAIITSTFSLNGLNAEYDWQVDFPLDPERAVEKAQKARELGADLVIGVQHAGTEYSTVPDVQQVGNAQQLMESGEFDFIYNHHTHSVQPLEEIDDKWILYGTGNNISESALPENRVNNEFLLTRVQFAQHEDGTWSTNDVAWTAATNMQEGGYKWCSVASDQPHGVCQGTDFDADVRNRTAETVNSMGAAEAGAHEWLITQE